MANPGDPSDTADALKTLGILLHTAAKLAGDLAAADPLFARLAQAFARMPVEDRETITTVIEREVELRRLGPSQGELVTGYDLVPNPSARLYLRVWEGDRRTPVMPRDELMHGLWRAARMARYALTLADDCEPALLATVRAMPADERVALREVHREMLALIERVEQELETRAERKA